MPRFDDIGGGEVRDNDTNLVWAKVPTAALLWDEAVAAKLEAMGCPTALVQHHVNALAASGTSNHVTAAYEILLQAERAGATNAELA
jgi:hypothetical protein